MIKLIWLLKRMPGISHAQFRAHYEGSHVVLAKRHFGHLLTDYVRNYPSETLGPGQPDAFAWDYDCIAEWHIAGEEQLRTIWEILNDPAIGSEFLEDETHFLDKPSVVQIRVKQDDCVNTGTRL